MRVKVLKTFKSKQFGLLRANLVVTLPNSYAEDLTRSHLVVPFHGPTHAAAHLEVPRGKAVTPSQVSPDDGMEPPPSVSPPGRRSRKKMSVRSGTTPSAS